MWNQSKTVRFGLRFACLSLICDFAYVPFLGRLAVACEVPEYQLSLAGDFFSAGGCRMQDVIL